MAERWRDVQENIEERITFPASMSKQEKNVEVVKMVDDTFSRRGLLPGHGEREISSPELNADIEKSLQTAEQALSSLGIENAKEVLPTRDQIVLIKNRPGMRDAGYVTGNGTLLTLVLPSGQARQVFFHELSHFVSKRFAEKKPQTEDARISQLGFDRKFRVPVGRHGAREHVYFKGVFEEPAADLFSLYCMQNEKYVAESSYAKKDAFVGSLLEEFAKRKGISPLEAFKKMYKAKTEQDFSFQKELVEIFGTEVVKELNNVVTNSSEGKDSASSVYRSIARKGGFALKYLYKASQLHIGRSISYPGIPGRIKFFS